MISSRLQSSVYKSCRKQRYLWQSPLRFSEPSLCITNSDARFSIVKVYNDAVRLMAGIYLGNVLNYCREDQTLSQIIWNMYSNIVSGVPANTTVSHYTELNFELMQDKFIQLMLLQASGVFFGLGFSIPSTSNSPTILTFFLKGIFSCVRSSVFFIHLPCGDTLLHVLFDAVCKASELHEEIQFHSLQGEGVQ